MSPAIALTAIKLVHTIVWALFAGAILVMGWFILRRRWGWVLALHAKNGGLAFKNN
jgi:hypothetical protein